MKIIKQAVEIGNGAAVYVPKEYKGKNDTIILPDGIYDIKKRILSELIDYMDNILGVYLYGSYARGEHTKESDIDILIIVKDKDENIKKILKNEFSLDARIATLDSIKKSLKDIPLLIYPIIKESIVWINPTLLDELKKYKLDYKKLKWNFDEIKRTIKIVEDFINLDDEISSSHIYSLLMRIRLCFIIECLLKEKIFSNKGVYNLLKDNKFSSSEINKFFKIYREVRENNESKEKISKEEILKLLNFLKEYSHKIENESKKKTKKRN